MKLQKEAARVALSEQKKKENADKSATKKSIAPAKTAAKADKDGGEGDENLSDADTLIMGPPEKARKSMMRKPSAAQRVEASEDVPGKSPTLDRQEPITEASEDELTSQWTPIGETCGIGSANVGR